MNEFKKFNIIIPDSLLTDFDNKIQKKKIKRNNFLLEKIRK